MKRSLTLICCLTVFSICGLAQKKSVRPAMSDQQFVNFAGQTDMVDANLGQLARKVSLTGNIKGYAQKLVTDQTNDFHDLAKAAHESSLNIPNAIDEEHDKTIIDPFHKLNGAAFNRHFVEEMIKGDTRVIGIYKREAAHAQTATLRSYAADALPMLQADLAKVKKMETAKTTGKEG